MAEEPLISPNLSDSRDMLTLVISVGSAAVPVVGGPVAEVLNRYVKANYETALEEFRREVATRLNSLTNDADLRERLAAPEFTEMFLRTVRIAESTSQQEKRAWLANAVVNCLRADAADNLDRLRNLRLIDQLMPVHVHLLQFLVNPESCLAKWRTRLPEDPDSTDGAALAGAVPWLPTEEYAAAIVTDLQEMELISRISSRNFADIFNDGEPETYSLPAVLPRAASLLEFIAEPPDAH